MKDPTIEGARYGLTMALRNLPSDSDQYAVMLAALNNMHARIFLKWNRMSIPAKNRWDCIAKSLVRAAAAEFRKLLGGCSPS